MPPANLAPLPIDPHVDGIADLLRKRRAAVVVAMPGAGKTTRVPPALTTDGPVLLLQPRRVAARAIARRIAQERGWTLGDEVGWQVRFERRFTDATRLLVATEGILTARLQSDPLLSRFRTVILDEFHERTLHADLGLALMKQAMAAREDLRVLIMSATIDAAAVSRFLGGCPVVEVPGRTYPIEVQHAPGLSLADAVRRVLGGAPSTAATVGHLLCFLPGAPEIRRAESDLRAALGDSSGPRILPLHGSLDAEAQEAALAPSSARKVILATNIAETSLTLEGVTDVIDTGLHKVLRHDPEIGLDRLLTERIPLDSAEQRAGRAGRTAPGRALRLYDPREPRRPHREPEIARIDLAAPLLDILAWGGDPRTFEWFEAPPEERITAALALLEALGAVDAGRRITSLGSTLQRFPLHPRLARFLVAAGGSSEAAAACAVLSEGFMPRFDAAGPPTTVSDLLLRADRLRQEAPAVRQAASELHTLAARIIGGPAKAGSPPATEEAFLRAALAAYPDRVARRREPGSNRFVMASGRGATLGRESGVREAEYIVAPDIAGAPEAFIRMASAIERDWLTPTGRDMEHRFEKQTGRVRAFERVFYFDLLLSETPATPDPARAAALLAAACLERGLDDDAQALMRRLRFAGLASDAADLVRQACAGRTTLPKRLDLAAHLPPALLHQAGRLAPETLSLPSGRSTRLEYRDDGSVVASVKLQELFGLADTPRVGAERTPVTFSLLAPNGRPVQTTRDLRSFWEKTYPEVRREMRARYPRHPWPEDPWTATPTHRTTRRKS